MVRVRATVRGGNVHDRPALERAFAPSPEPSAADPAHWRAVLDQMLRDGCCTPQGQAVSFGSCRAGGHPAGAAARAPVVRAGRTRRRR
ncbi:hypothetical protein B6R96_01615 [Streptomyces sp. Sge12]|uniref:hypothetical protein n=1 Tax=Streptomyces sp. Sge12 TaxID=1972846 RepID=UPI0009C1B568|nr:hypothetical protein [Streptomyces sp. Sge12]ARE72806.1 hypothetical protein B6R96_01615 [Streptomyces sp. Sge12]